MVVKKCSICDRRFTKAEHCKRHERSHTREKPYECPVCKKRYSRSDVLGRHVRGHEQKANAPANHNTPSPIGQEVPAQSPNTLTTPHGRVSVQNGEQHVSPMNNRNHAQMDMFHNQAFDGIPLQGSSNNNLLQHRASMSGLQDNAAMNTISPTAQHHQLQSPTGEIQAWSMEFPMDDAQANGNIHPDLLKYGAGMATQAVQATYNTDGQLPPTSNNGNINDMLQSWLLHPESEGRSQSGSFDLTAAGIFNFDNDHLPTRQFTDATDGSKQGDNIPNERFARVEQCWITRSSSVSRLIRTLWWDVIHSEMDNIFSLNFVPSTEAHSSQIQGSRRGVDEECRLRLQTEFCSTDAMRGQTSQFSIGSPSSSNRRPSGFADQIALGTDPNQRRRDLHSSDFPPAEILDMSLDLYFRQFHPLVPFIHTPTYCAKAVPLPMFFTQCLIGLIILGTTGASNFVSKAFPTILSRVTLDMTDAALGSGSPSGILSTLASAFLLLHLAALTGDGDSLEQSHMLYVNLISVAQRHGLFTVNDGARFDTTMLEAIPDLEQRWTAWSRVESVKRLCAGLLRMDSWFASFLYTTPIIRPDNVQLTLPCEDSLFHALSARRWQQLMEIGVTVSMPTVVSTPEGTNFPGLSVSLDVYSLSTLMSIVQLRICEGYHRLFCGSERQSEQEQFLVPWRAYATDSRAHPAVPLVIEIYSNNAGRFGNMNPNCLTLWHKMCIMLTADIRIFELAAGRAGASPARKALDDIAAWTQTPAARRACIHAAQIFKLLTNRKASDGINFPSASSLFTSALILGLYVFMLPPNPVHNENSHPLELMDDVDWKRLGTLGLTVEEMIDPATLVGEDAAAHFIRNGGTIYISGIQHQPGYQSARRVLLDYASLLKEVGKRSARRFSRILFIMSDVLMDVDGHVPDEGL